jgi:ribonucleotide reductase alpha subunit
MMPDGKGGKKLYNREALYRINIDAYSILHLQELGFEPKRLDIKNCRAPHHITNRYITITKVEDLDEYDDTYCFNEPLRHAGVFNGVLTGQCAEITEISNSKETAVCNLSSIALGSFVKKDADGKLYFDFDMLHHVARVVTRNLNKVIDRTFYPIPETEYSNRKHRPVGLGVQGLADTFAMLRMPFDSPEAAQLNREIFETIYHGSVSESMSIAREREQLLAEMESHDTQPKRKTAIRKKLHLTEGEKKLDKWRGAYETFAGSPASQGKLQFDLWSEADGLEIKHTGRWDWDTLRADVMKYGMRNSLLTALMPTASTSQILGFNESIEPFTSNIYQRRVLSGEFTVLNKHLIRDLIQLGIWNGDLKDQILVNNGSIQNIDGIPDNIKALYKTVWEIKQKVLIDQSSDRGMYICQTQSLNLFIEDPDIAKLTNMHFYAWKRGLKTGLYYLRTRPKARTAAFTLKVDKRQSAAVTSEMVMACSRENPGACELCSS